MTEEPLSAARELRPQRREFTTADGVRLVADTLGKPGSPGVVLMHGGGQTRHSWSGAVGALAEAGYFVVNYDARGHGDSGWSTDGVYDYHLRAADLLSIVRELAGPCALLGASMGGITALQAVSEGYTPGALVLVDIVPNPERRGIERIREFMLRHSAGFANAEEAMAAVAAYNPNRPKPATSSGLMRNLRAGAGGRLYWHWDPRILPSSLNEAMADRELLFERMHFNPAIPTLLIRGLRSEVVSDAGVAQFRRLLPALEVADVARAGHMVAGDDNDVFNTAAVDYLQRTFPAALRARWG
jgi:pimeloyl-ACP methyl ester carboxylesterase